ncbi:MAG TPA: hypothetical protein VI434_08155 [Candidatus Dormibacteraeota bacterium]
MAQWWEIAIAAIVVALAAAVCGFVGWTLGAHQRQRRDDLRLQSSVEAYKLARRASTYLEVAFGWHTYLRAVRRLAFPEEDAASYGPGDLSAVLRCRAQLQRFGTPAVQQLHDEALDQAVTVISLLRAVSRPPVDKEWDLVGARASLRVAVGVMSNKIGVLDGTMNQEMSWDDPAAADEDVELTGRARRPTPAAVQTR